MNVKLLASPDFNEDERDLIVTDLLALKKEQIGEFLTRSELPKSGTKEELRGRIEESLENETLTLSRIVQFLDEVIPWGKQHVCLYKGPSSSITNWRDTEWLTRHLKKHRLGRFLNANLPLILPEKMKVSSILHDSGRIRITAIKRRDWWERSRDYDTSSTTAEGDDIELRAFIHRVTRSLVAFEWNFVANNALLQISQLPTGFDYAEVAEEFFALVQGWLDISKFAIVDLRPPIKKLHELEEAGAGETRSHGINYRTLQGRRFEGKSPSPAESLLGEPAIDAAFREVRRSGIGHLGNFYWLPSKATNPNVNPLDRELHVIVVGSKSRVNFPTPNDERTVRYVLSRIRSHCA